MHSLRFKLIAPFVFGALLVTITLAFYTYSSARREMEQAALSIASAKTNHAVGTMGLLHKSMNMALYNMVSDPNVGTLFAETPPSEQTLEAATDWMEIVVRSNEYYRDLYIVDKEGFCLVSSNPGFEGENRSKLPHVRSALSGHFSMGESSVGRVTKKFSLTMAGPIDVGGAVAGALVMVNDFPNIVGYDQQTSFDSQTVFLAMLTPDGMFAAHKDNALMGNKKARFPELYKQLALVRDQGGPVSYVMDGETYVGYAKVEPNTRWVVVSSGKQSEVLASAYRMGLVVAIISFLFLCLITFIVVRFASGILNAMLSLIEYAKAVSEGDLARSLEDTQRKDELGVLHTALQRVVATLRDSLEEAQKASEMKGQFLANMSHEIRTPLNAIMGMTHIMLQEPSLTGKLRDFAEKIRISSRLLFGLINDILDLSKVEAGMIELEQLPFDLREVVQNTLVIHQATAQSKGLDLVLDYTPDLPHHFVGDALRIGQILNNLLSNAIKFTGEGSVTVRCWRGAAAPAVPAGPTASSEVAALPQGDELAGQTPTETQGEQDERGEQNLAVMHVSVIDTGVGIAEHMLERLFNPFTQADSSITRQYGGTGLGLTISRRLVHLMGGQLDIESKLHHGSTLSFSMRLKLASGKEGRDSTPTALAAAQRPRLDGRHILVVEDNPINQAIMEELIKPLGARVSLADNGQEAVEAVERESFDLIFMDVQMPVLDGLEATRRIRARIGADLPIVAVTANAMKEDCARCTAAGMNAYITKPVDPTAMTAMIYEWLR